MECQEENDLNIIYISERLQEKLRPISRCTLTTVVAPMGYGKTTAVNWYLNERVKKGRAVVIRISIYTNNLPIFWKSVQNAFRFAGFNFFEEYECPSDLASAGLFADDLSHLLAGETDDYIFIDDFHLLTDARILLASLKAEDVLNFLSKCPKEDLEAYPLSVLVLMRCMFNWRKIPEMLKLKEFLIQAIDRHKEIPEEERGNLLGECDLITGFLMYNDISKMSHFHRSASRQMSRPAISIRNDGGWTFGSPSVLMMFHREPGGLLKEQEEMRECMPHYYKITNGHGQGAEALFIQGHFADAQIALEGAYAQIEENGQESMALCCDFLLRRLSLCMDIKQKYSFEQRRKALSF